MDLRIPLLVKGVLPLPGIRLALIIGPEFVIPLKTEAAMDAPVSTAFDFKVESSFRTLLTFGLDMVVELPIDLRFFYNPSQPSDWSDRVELISSVPGAVDRLTIQYQNS